MEHKRNVEVREKMKVNPFIEKVKKTRLRRIGCVYKKEEANAVKVAFLATVSGMSTERGTHT